jgi:mRNA interferase RelE/StbE
VSNATYAVIIVRSAQKEIKALDQAIRARILQALHSLSSDPRPSGCRKLVGAQNRWRVRVGDYRIIYEINDAGSSLNIIAVRHRSKAYE